MECSHHAYIANLSTPATGHLPVMLDETLQYLYPRSGATFIDGTFGGGGHSRALLEQTGPDGTVLAIDADPAALNRVQPLQQEFGERLIFRQGNFRDISAFAASAGLGLVDGILFDLGLSSFQLDTPERGFAFRFDAPLDMRFDPEHQMETAADIVNTRSPRDLAWILRTYGEERQANRIARAIDRFRETDQVQTTDQLRSIVESVIPRRHNESIHPATRTFQALRIAVNAELESLELAIDAAIGMLRPGGRLAIISFHSLEDRIVKHRFREAARDCICPPKIPICQCDHRSLVRVLTPKPVQPAESERDQNPRSRSARLRSVERLP